MTLQEYEKQALATFLNGSAADGGRYDEVHSGKNALALTHGIMRVLRSAAHSASVADLWKRGLYYGKFPEGKTIQVLIPHDSNAYAAPDISRRMHAPMVRDVVHSILGFISETGELADWLLQYLNGLIPEDVFLKRLREETGDILWYDNLAAQSCGGLEATATVNIEKLTARRRGTKYTTEAAVNRDLSKEDAIVMQNREELHDSKGEDQ